jgi:hypothetical protein
MGLNAKRLERKAHKMSDEKEVELLPCPFACVTCPDSAFVTPSTYYVFCPFCQAKGPVAGSHEEAVDYWNTRTTPPTE